MRVTAADFPDSPVSFTVTPPLLISRLSYLSGLHVDKKCVDNVQVMVRLKYLKTSSFHISTETSYAVYKERYALSPCNYVDITATAHYENVTSTAELDACIKIKVEEHDYENMVEDSKES